MGWLLPGQERQPELPQASAGIKDDDMLTIFHTHTGRLTVRSFWKSISKNWKFSFEEQRTSNAVSISLWTTARLTNKRPEKTIRKTGKFFNIIKYNRLQI